MKIFDRVHGEMHLTPAAAHLAVHPAVFRLDAVRQLGGCVYVYPSATHTRREHSLGVAHLAGVWARHLGADERDVACVEVAGLVHDLGHGPFSHLFEDYVRESRPEWSHEEMALVLFDGMDTTPFFSDADRAFVRVLVRGLDAHEDWPTDAVGRDASKRFLTDLVHNKPTGLDVDKLDYLARDHLAVFGRPALDLGRLLRGTRVVEVEERRTTVAFDESVAPAVAEVYALRAKLHRQVYQYRNVVVVEGRLRDLMRDADERALPGRRFVDACDDPNLFLRLTDASVVDHHSSTHASLLLQRPIRLPVTACLRTTPACFDCGADTRLSDAFCVTCGASTVTRRGVAHDASSPALVPPECILGSDEVTRMMCIRLGRDDVRVHIVDVHCGAAVATTDPHGRVWRDYDPLRRVVFCSGDDLVSVTPVCLPERRHVRTAHCYLPATASPAEVAAAGEAFAEWVRTVGEVVERV